MSKATHFPRKGYRVIWKDGKPVVVERELIGRNGSWTISRRRDGSIEKENGCSWAETIVEAIEREANLTMCRYTMPNLFNLVTEHENMCLLIREAMEWGVLLGEINQGRRDV